MKWIVAVTVTTILTATLNPKFAWADSEKIEFKKKMIVITQGKVQTKIQAEMAESEAQHEYGLMFRKELGPKEGMLFVFKDELIRSFWMKNTIINLSIGYFNKNKKLIDIQEMKAVTSVLQTDIPTYPSESPAQYALEMPEGWFKKNSIKVGAQLKIIE